MIQPKVQNKKKIIPVANVTLEQILKARQDFCDLKEFYERKIAAINADLLELLNAENLTGKVVGRVAISKVRRVTFRTSLDEARQLGAVKEAVDTDVLRGLYDKGATIMGAQVTEYIMVKDVKKPEDKSL